MSKSRNIADLLDNNGDVKTTSLDNVTITGTEVAATLTAGTNVTISAGGEISSTDTDTVYDSTAIDAAVALNTAKVTNVSTNLSKTATTTDVTINSSDGANVAVGPATTLVAGVMTKAIFDQHVLNNAKVTNVAHPLVETAVPVGALFTDTNTTYVSSDFVHDSLTGFVANEHIDWTGSSAGVIHLTNLPATALTSVQTAIDQASMLALTTQEGDVVVRSDTSETYMRNSGVAGTMADFTLLATPTDAVASVDGATGVVTLNHDTLTGFVANEHIDWTVDQGATNVHAGNYTDTNTVYTHPSGDGNLHVPATSTTNSGLVLTAGGTAGSLSWTAKTVNTDTVYDSTAIDAAVALNTAKVTNVSTNLSKTATTTDVTINSSDGANVAVGPATTLVAGVMTKAIFDEHVLNNAKVSDINHNVTTNLSTTHNVSTVVVNSSDGTNATINAATATTAGIMSEAIFDQHVLNNAKVSDINHNVTTNLSTTAAPTTVTINSSDGTNATIATAGVTNAGVMTKAIFDEHVLNNAKVSNIAQTTVSGNAGTATTLQTARTINGVSFDGSAAITVTANANLAGNLLTAVPVGALFTDTVTASFPAGTAMVFHQAAAPTGWTQVTTQNDKALRVVSTAGGGSGGTHALTVPPSTAHTHTGPSHTHTGPSHTHSTPNHSHAHTLSAGAHTLTTAQMPSHSHAFTARTGGNTSGNVNQYWVNAGAIGVWSVDTTVPSNPAQAQGGGASHDHALAGSISSGGAGTSGAGGTGNTGSSGTGATGSAGPTAFAPQYIDVIVCTKD